MKDKAQTHMMRYINAVVCIFGRSLVVSFVARPSPDSAAKVTTQKLDVFLQYFAYLLVLKRHMSGLKGLPCIYSILLMVYHVISAVQRIRAFIFCCECLAWQHFQWDGLWLQSIAGSDQCPGDSD